MSNPLFNIADTKRTPRSVFNLSYTKTLTCDLGQLIPICHDELVPEDVVQIGNQIIVRMQPMVAPVMHEINAYVHYFFVPNRLLMNRDTIEDLQDDGTWEDFITGGREGDDATTLPTWTPTVDGTDNAIGTLWDYLGYPVDIDPDGFEPIDFGRRAYNLIYNEYYRDQNLLAPISLQNEDLLYRCWEKDYFTSALPWTARGDEPALPVTITGVDEDMTWYNETDTTARTIQTRNDVDAEDRVGISGNPTASDDMRWGNTALESESFDINDLRLATQTQIWLERNARAGVRYNEFLRAHFNGIGNGDARLQRPEYIGGSKVPIVISEVLQTESSDAATPQGTMAGHGITIDSRFIGKYRATEYGWLFGILSIMPRSVYSQGINRQWIKTTKYDYYFPEFAGLGEQEVYEGELYATEVSAQNNTVFGYQGRYNELRYKPNMVCGEIRTQTEGGSLYYWTISREFDARPTLNSTFVSTASIRKDWLAVDDEPTCIVHFANHLKAARPLPAYAVPGGMDHA